MMKYIKVRFIFPMWLSKIKALGLLYVDEIHKYKGCDRVTSVLRSFWPFRYLTVFVGESEMVPVADKAL